MKILTRYLLQAHLGPFLFAFFALTGVVLINTLAGRLADLAGKGLPLRVVLEFFVLALPAAVALTVPMAVLVSVLHTFATFTAENEITALRASGVDLRRLLLPLLAAAGVVTAAMIWFNDRVLAEANHRWATLQDDIARKTPTLVLQPQTLNRISGPGLQPALYLRAARVDARTNRLWDVVIFELGRPGLARTIFADSGRAVFAAARTALVMHLFDGHVREVDPEDPRGFTRIYFREQTLGVAGVGSVLDRSRAEGRYRSDRELTIARLNARIDTLRSERRALLRSLRDRAGADLDLALAGAAVAPSLPEAGGDAVRLRTRRTAHELRALEGRVTAAERDIRAYAVEVHKKYSIAAAALVFVIVGAPLALRFGNGGTGMVIATSLAIFSLYYVGLIGGEALADAGKVTPLAAMWGVNALMAGGGRRRIPHPGTRDRHPPRRRVGRAGAGPPRRAGADGCLSPAPAAVRVRPEAGRRGGSRRRNGDGRRRYHPGFRNPGGDGSHPGAGRPGAPAPIHRPLPVHGAE